MDIPVAAVQEFIRRIEYDQTDEYEQELQGWKTAKPMQPSENDAQQKSLQEFHKSLIPNPLQDIILRNSQLTLKEKQTQLAALKALADQPKEYITEKNLLNEAKAVDCLRELYTVEFQKWFEQLTDEAKTQKYERWKNQKQEDIYVNTRNDHIFATYVENIQDSNNKYQTDELQISTLASLFASSNKCLRVIRPNKSVRSYTDFKNQVCQSFVNVQCDATTHHCGHYKAIVPISFVQKYQSYLRKTTSLKIHDLFYLQA